MRKIFAAAAVLLAATVIAVVAQAPAQQTPAQPPPAPPPSTQTPPVPGGRGRGGVGSFPAQQREPGDPALVARGSSIYSAQCGSCHAPDLRGGQLGAQRGPNLLRNQLVLNDQQGELIGQAIQDSHKAQGMPAINLTPDDVKAVAAFIHSVLALAPGQGAPPPGPPVSPLSILVGDATAGQAYFAAKCSSCHSVTGDLSRIGARGLGPVQLQNLWVSGGGGRGGRGAAPGRGLSASGRRAITVTVTLPSGQKVEGQLDRIDDFLVTLVQRDGTRRTFRRDGDVPKVEVRDPLEAHRNLLTVYTDKDIHDVTAYLARVK